MKILVIDDEEGLRLMMQMALRQRGYEAVGASNGAMGVELARQELILKKAGHVGTVNRNS